MKKLIVMALCLVVASMTTAQAGDKKKANKKQTPAVEQLTLKTSQDTLSLASGIAATYGLDLYLQQQLKVDTAHMADFEQAFEEAIKNRQDPKFRARAAAYQIAEMTSERILPSAKNDFTGTKTQIDDSLFFKGFIRGIKKDSTLFSQQKALTYMQAHVKAAKEERDAEWKLKNTNWLAANAKADGVKTTADGLQYKVITMGTGAKPTATDKVKVKYEGKDIEGNVFDSSYKRNPQTAEFRCDQVIKGWSEALQLMPVGSKFELYIPQELGYGERQAGRIKPFSTLIFTVELDDIVKDEPKADASKTTTTTAKKPVRKTAPRKK